MAAQAPVVVVPVPFFDFKEVKEAARRYYFSTGLAEGYRDFFDKTWENCDARCDRFYEEEAERHERTSKTTLYSDLEKAKDQARKLGVTEESIDQAVDLGKQEAEKQVKRDLDQLELTLGEEVVSGASRDQRGGNRNISGGKTGSTPRKEEKPKKPKGMRRVGSADSEETTSVVFVSASDDGISMAQLGQLTPQTNPFLAEENLGVWITSRAA